MTSIPLAQILGNGLVFQLPLMCSTLCTIPSIFGSAASIFCHSDKDLPPPTSHAGLVACLSDEGVTAYFTKSHELYVPATEAELDPRNRYALIYSYWPNRQDAMH